MEVEIACSSVCVCVCVCNLVLQVSHILHCYAALIKDNHCNEERETLLNRCPGSYSSE